jgi:hypothetical protein
VKDAFDNAKRYDLQAENGKQIVLAMHNHESSMGQLPHPYVQAPTALRPWKRPTDPTTLLSWRVAILPYINQHNLHKRFDLDGLWNSPKNLPHSTVAVNYYSDIETPNDPQSRWKVFYDGGAMFDLDPNVRTSFTNITDGTSNTIMIVEGGTKATWTQFSEYKYDPKGPFPAFGQPNPPGGVPKFLVGMGDGSVRPVRQSVDPAILHAAITKAGGEVISFGLFD